MSYEHKLFVTKIVVIYNKDEEYGIPLTIKT